MQPFSDNVIFWDTEFSSLDPYNGELLSIGMIKLSGEELYVEIEYDGELSEFTKEQVVPFLTGNKVSREEARRRVAEFLGKEKPFLISYVSQFDIIYLLKLFGAGDTSTRNHPFHWISLDLAAMFFALGRDPESMSVGLGKRDAFCSELGIDDSKYQKHNALDDARLLREIYLKLIGK